MGEVINLFKRMGGKQMPSIYEVADTFLTMHSFSNKKLQKLCYYAEAWYWAVNNKPLTGFEYEAWIHGPVCPDLYYTYKNYGYCNIMGKHIIPECIENNEYLKTFLTTIYSMYGDMSADKLELLTHNETPWLNARGNTDTNEPSHNIIDTEHMRIYYSSLEKN